MEVWKEANTLGGGGGTVQFKLFKLLFNIHNQASLKKTNRKHRMIWSELRPGFTCLGSLAFQFREEAQFVENRTCTVSSRQLYLYES